MSKASATYRRYPDGQEFTVEYDTEDPCAFCGLPVIAASVGGTACCPWCDMGTCRYDKGHRIDLEIGGPKAHYAKHHPPLTPDATTETHVFRRDMTCALHADCGIIGEPHTTYPAKPDATTECRCDPPYSGEEFCTGHCATTEGT